jgi:hypothetical protein
LLQPCTIIPFFAAYYSTPSDPYYSSLIRMYYH